MTQTASFRVRVSPDGSIRLPDGNQGRFEPDEQVDVRVLGDVILVSKPAIHMQPAPGRQGRGADSLRRQWRPIR